MKATRHVAFLRAINVGGRRVTMARLRELFEELDLTSVATFIASGNVVFEWDGQNPAGLEREIEAHLLASLGFEVETFVRSAAELSRIDGLELFPDHERGREDKIHVLLLREEPGEEVSQNLRELETEEDRFHVEGREVYWLRRGPMALSAIGTAELTRAVAGAVGTMRNVNTMRRIRAKFFC